MKIPNFIEKTKSKLHAFHFHLIHLPWLQYLKHSKKLPSQLNLQPTPRENPSQNSTFLKEKKGFSMNLLAFMIGRFLRVKRTHSYKRVAIAYL